MVNNLTLYLFYSLVAFLTLYYVSFIYKNWRLLKFSWNQNGFFWPILPFVGSAYIGWFAALTTGVPVNALTMLQWAKKYFGYPFNFWFGSSYCYVTTNPEEIRIIFNHPKCFNKGKVYEPVTMLFPESVLVVPYEKWKTKRKFIQTSYKTSVLKTFVPTYYKQSCKLLKEFDDMNNCQDLFNYFSKYSFVNFFLTSAGLEEEKCYPDLEQLGAAIARLQDELMSRFINPTIPLNIWLRFFPAGQKFIRNQKEITRIAKDLIKQKQQQNYVRKESINPDKEMALFDLIMSFSNMDEQEILDEITFITMAATETTGNALTFCFILLGMHSEIQEILYKEVINVVGENDILSDDLPKLKYTKAVIQETLRLFPSAPAAQRHIGVDVHLGSQVIPKGVQFSADIFHLHRDEKYWPNPLKFDPDRFLPENASKIKAYTYIPFSAGPRDCLGKRQAMELMQITVANLIRKLKITSNHKSVDEFVLTSVVTMKPAHPINCQFSPRLVN